MEVVVTLMIVNRGLQIMLLHSFLLVVVWLFGCFFFNISEKNNVLQNTLVYIILCQR